MMDDWDIEKLALMVTGMANNEADKFMDSKKDAIAEFEYHAEIYFYDFKKVVRLLTSFTVTTESPLTGTKYQGFVDNVEGCYIVKSKLEESK